MLTDEELEKFTEEFEAEDETEGDEPEEQEEAKKPEVDEEEEAESPDNSSEADNQTSDDEVDKTDYANLWEGLSEKQREEVTLLQSELAKARHADQSNRGRQKALHAKVQELETEREALLSKATQEPKAEVKPEHGLDEEYSADELDTLREEYPEINALIRNSTGNLVQQVKDLEARLETAKPVEQPQQPVEQPQEMSQSDVQRELDKVATAHPDYEKVRRDPNFTTWLSREPRGIQALASSYNADDAIALLDRFKQGRKPVDRKSELGAMTNMPNKGAIDGSNIREDDFDSLMEQFADKIRDENKR